MTFNSEYQRYIARIAGEAKRLKACGSTLDDAIDVAFSMVDPPEDIKDTGPLPEEYAMVRHIMLDPSQLDKLANGRRVV